MEVGTSAVVGAGGILGNTIVAAGVTLTGRFDRRAWMRACRGWCVIARVPVWGRSSGCYIGRAWEWGSWVRGDGVGTRMSVLECR